MTIFESPYPDIGLPKNKTVWEFFFDPVPDLALAPQGQSTGKRIGGFTDAVTQERLSYSEIKQYATYVSTALSKRFGMKAGDVAGFFSTNTIWYPVAMHGTLRIGGIISGASPAYNMDEMVYALETAGAKFFFTIPDSLEMASAAAAKAGLPQDRIILLKGTGSLNGHTYTTLQDLIDIGKSYGTSGQVEQFRVPAGKTNGDVCGYISFSSGTTGLPKGVMISHGNVIAQCLQMKQLSTMDKALAVLPLFHITGLVHTLHSPIMFNAEVYMMPFFELRLMLESIVRYHIEEISIVPPLLIRLIRDPVVKEFDLSFVKEFHTGAAPLPQEVVNELARQFPGAGIRQGWGMTESTSCITATPKEFVNYIHAHTVGKIVGSTQVKIIDVETGEELGYGKLGEILGRGPQITMGYLRNPTATASTYDADGFLHTGDLGDIDENGFIVIRDRLKELIKVKGVGVAPAELEDCLLGHPAVEDAAVLGVPHDYSGEEPKAYVVLKQEGGWREKDPKEMEDLIKKYVVSKKARSKHITGGVVFVEEIPKSPSGKILRRIMRDWETKARSDKAAAIKAKL